MSSGEAEEIRRFLAGDEGAFQAIMNRWHRPIVNFLYRCTGSQDDAAELAQETFQTVARRLGDLKDPARFSSWIYKIALNHSRMRMRKQRNRQMESLDAQTFENNEPKDSYQSLTLNTSLSPEERLSKQEMARVVRQALDRIEPKQREVIVLKEYSGLRFHEIAEVLDAPISTIKSRMYLGLESLRREIIKIIRP
ncbi:MAG TPA: sigma-70 family RNA polymerase sigma factor [Acidobacteriota bacterium]|nr:sigma-70 family RNA polymerase sigma factor [Acidobacteriota bacterium]HNR39360.1 sigma-70 family RNA polymerase sigma factor [Acidobacteriota bacterium]HNT99495.1 sigma-70 family RNA polymerase sigma factor [Acidobacteriota bacterium]HPB28457.1 sigma-70 family RNA polymerase sigma factor [Acidobacteriota bacterium]HQO26400.1 sigma-70 family RNA polymerase sigma factor [Acidobacteriota bacterium]